MLTLRDIAKEAGVNKSTVSRALNDTGNISEAKKEEILGIAQKLGYLPNDSAKILAGKKAKTIGIILPEIDCNYYATVVGSIEEQLKEKGYSLIIGQTGFEYSNELHYLKLFIQKKVDGIICDLYNVDRFKSEYNNIKQYLKSPIVFIESDPGISDFDVIEIDESYGMQLAIKHFVDSDAKRIGFISEHLSAKIRLPAFISAMKKYDMPIDDSLIKVGSDRLEMGGYLRMMELIKEGHLPDAIFVSYDTMAQGALKAIMEEGIRCPEDLMIAGFDNIREAEYFTIPLTSVAPPIAVMSTMAVERIISSIEGKVKGTIKIKLQPKIMIRQSSSKKNERG